MKDMASSNTFTTEDYVVFSVMLVISSCIGLFFGIRSRIKKETSANDLLTGNRKLPWIPVALSLSASFTSATTILGIPAEVYTRGGEQWLWCLGLILCFPFVAFCMLPLIYKLHLTNAYEYLELRFSRAVRRIGSCTFSVIILLYMAAVLYAPAVALNQVTGLDRDISIVAIGAVCTLYTSLGGIRGVVWTDVFQLIVVWVGLLVLMFKGASDTGGWTKVWELSREGDRLPRFDMDPDPFIRHTFWTLLIGGGTNMMTVYGANQANLQRYFSVGSLRESQMALMLNLPLWICYLTILCLLGLVMYASFLTCDPLGKGYISKSDQLIPYFVLQTMGDYPGLPGLFIATIFSASISTISSGINSLGAVTLEDLFKPIYQMIKKEQPPRSALTFATIVLVIFFGGLTIALAYLAQLLGKTALTISFGVFGMVGGPLLGLLINGMFFPFINKWGAIAGWFSSLVICLYVGIDAVINPTPKRYLPLNSSCLDNQPSSRSSVSVTIVSTSSVSPVYNVTVRPQSDSDDHLYLSYLHYSTLALLVSVIFGILVSAITGFNKRAELDDRTYHKYTCCNQSSSSYRLDNKGNHSTIKNRSFRGATDSDPEDYSPYTNSRVIRSSKNSQDIIRS